MQLWIEQNQWLMKLKLLITEKVEYTAEIEDTLLKKKGKSVVLVIDVKRPKLLMLEKTI